ncbi:MAG: hypothetical protein MJ053_06785 [Elusimicrobiaceae bacterium]|nr:hypothetical protein [Elusimicrobiaceae bacterium]
MAAVALPQYQKAVYKSRYAVMWPIVRALAQAEEMYYLANGIYSTRFDELSMDLPAGGSPSGHGSDGYKYSWGICVISIDTSEQVVFCENTNIHMRIQAYLEHSPALHGKIFCNTRGAASDLSSIQNKICKAETGSSNYYSHSEGRYTTWKYQHL